MKNLSPALLGAFLLAVFTFSACQTETAPPNANSAANSAANNADGAPKLENGKPVFTDKGVFTLEFKSNPTALKTGEKAELIFELKDPAGKNFKDLEIVHEKPIHLLIVSEDLDEFYHEHPEPQADGTFKAQFAFPHGGKYRLFADFKPQGLNQSAQNFAVSVAGAERASVDLKPDGKLEKTVGNLRVAMKPSGELISGASLMLNFEVFDAASGQPVTDLENYLGEKAHFVIVSKDLAEFVHAHPSGSPKDNEKSGGHQHGAHGDHPKMANPGANPSQVAAHVTFPKSGIYKIWAEIKRGGTVVKFPYAVEVKAGKDEKVIDTSNVQVPEGAVKILVTNDGFAPQEVSYKKGQPLKLAFYRAEAGGCTEEIAFKSLNIKKKLPVGEVVTIDIPTEKTGTISFACGMNMFKGQIIVE